MTTVVEMPLRTDEKTKRVNDGKDEFFAKIKKSQFVTYTREYFADCFLDDPRLVKAINFRLLNLKSGQRPAISNYTVSWEDIPREEEENWLGFQQKVNEQLKKFLVDLESKAKIVEGKYL